MVSRWDGVEAGAIFGDESCEDVESPDGRLGTGAREESIGECEAFLEFGDIDAADFEHGTAVEFHFV